MDAKPNAQGSNIGIRSIVVVEDTKDIAVSIRYSLEHEGFHVSVATTDPVAIDLIVEYPPNLVLLDINLPGRRGVDLCRRFQIEASRVPVLLLTARSAESDEVLSLGIGSGDYLTKPFSTRELLARVSAILRRADGPEEGQPIYDDGVLVIDPWAFSVRYEGREVRLTRKELRVLEELARSEGRVVMREVLLDKIWGLRDYADSRTLDVHIKRVRAKLRNPSLIETITGVGYRLVGSRSKRT